MRAPRVRNPCCVLRRCQPLGVAATRFRRCAASSVCTLGDVAAASRLRRKAQNLLSRRGRRVLREDLQYPEWVQTMLRHAVIYTYMYTHGLVPLLGTYIYRCTHIFHVSLFTKRLAMNRHCLPPQKRPGLPGFLLRSHISVSLYNLSDCRLLQNCCRQRR